MFNKNFLDGAMNWAIKGKIVLMVVPNQYAVIDTSMRLNNRYMEDIPISERPSLVSVLYDDMGLKFMDAGEILVMSETNKDSFRGISCSVMYVHPWTRQFYDPDDVISACLEKGGIVF